LRGLRSQAALMKKGLTRTFPCDLIMRHSIIRISPHEEGIETSTHWYPPQTHHWARISPHEEGIETQIAATKCVVGFYRKNQTS